MHTSAVTSITNNVDIASYSDNYSSFDYYYFCYQAIRFVTISDFILACNSYTNSFRKKHLCVMYRLSPYRAASTLHYGYKKSAYDV